LISCSSNTSDREREIITVSIAPIGFFVKEIGGDRFDVNIMVPPGANPHIYEPYPRQVSDLEKSVAYISNGFLGFEMTWLDRFYELNSEMKRLSLGNFIEPLANGHEHEGDHTEGADPHYWVSPKCALKMASAISVFLCSIDTSGSEIFRRNYDTLSAKILEIDKMADSLFLHCQKKTFMIYHPNLAYIARDYGLEEIPVEYEGKEPPPSRMKELIDLAVSGKINTVFVQKEYDTKNARAIATEIGAEIVIIDPLSENWIEATTEIINSLNRSLRK
jgi:zinc transport system substrate-binding protein